MILRRARPDEAAVCYSFIEAARAYHASLGFEQWHSDYPTLQTVKDDIESGCGFVFDDEGKQVGYCCIIIGDEPAYREISGEWKTERAYAVVHRLAFGRSSRGKGMSAPAFELIKSYCVDAGIMAIRADTQEENEVMQHILTREGFSYCGLITFDGGPKLAYEWDK